MLVFSVSVFQATWRLPNIGQNPQPPEFRRWTPFSPHAARPQRPTPSQVEEATLPEAGASVAGRRAEGEGEGLTTQILWATSLRRAFSSCVERWALCGGGVVPGFKASNSGHVLMTEFHWAKPRGHGRQDRTLGTLDLAAPCNMRTSFDILLPVQTCIHKPSRETSQNVYRSVLANSMVLYFRIA